MRRKVSKKAAVGIGKAATAKGKYTPAGHRCEHCGKCFALAYGLKKHVRIHTGERPYKCAECGAGFTQSGGLRNHTVSKHKPETAFTCHHCGKEFPLKDRLKLHLRIHTGEKPYSCTKCKKKFARGSQLSQHMRSHSTLRPFSCSVCEAAFVSRSNLLSHIKRHQGEHDYICDVCGKEFVRRDGLQKHLAWFHNGLRAFECRVCNKKYKGHLLQHMRIHMSEKPHACSQCDMRFIQKSQLTVHERTHSGIRPYRCQVCHMAFSHSTALKMHVRRHTGEKPFKCLICPGKAFSQLPHLKKHMLAIHKTDKPYMCEHCRGYYKTKNQLVDHQTDCSKMEPKKGVDPDINFMSLEKMRLLLAVLLQKIATPTKLESLGYGKRLIDQVLIESIKCSGRDPYVGVDSEESEQLKKNVGILLEWTIPKVYMEKFKLQRRSTEELLEELTS